MVARATRCCRLWRGSSWMMVVSAMLVWRMKRRSWWICSRQSRWRRSRRRRRACHQDLLLSRRRGSLRPRSPLLAHPHQQSSSPHAPAYKKAPARTETRPLHLLIPLCHLLHPRPLQCPTAAPPPPQLRAQSLLAAAAQSQATQPTQRARRAIWPVDGRRWVEPSRAKRHIVRRSATGPFRLRHRPLRPERWAREEQKRSRHQSPCLGWRSRHRHLLLPRGRASLPQPLPQLVAQLRRQLI